LVLLKIKNLFKGPLLFLACLTSTGCTSIFFQPDSYYYVDPAKIGYTKSDVVFKSKDGTELHGWLFPCTPCSSPKGTIIQFHGNAQNMSSHYLSLVWLVHFGYDLFVFDYAGYGESGGKATDKSMSESSDAALAQAWESHLQRKSRSFIVYGQSLGGLEALHAVENFEHRPLVNLLVLDSAFSSYKRTAQSKLASYALTWIFSPLAWLLVSDEYSAKEKLGSLAMRKLVIHDHHDPVVPYDRGEALYKDLPEPKEFWELDQGRHVGVFALDNKDYRVRFVNLLKSLTANEPGSHPE